MSFFKKVGATFDAVGAQFESTYQSAQSAFKPKEEEKHSHSHQGEECNHLHPDEHTENRFHSFAPESSGNVKWYVDGCTYFWAVSEAIERMAQSYLTIPCASLTPFHRGSREHLYLGLVAEPRDLSSPPSIQE